MIRVKVTGKIFQELRVRRSVFAADGCERKAGESDRYSRTRSSFTTKISHEE